MPKVLFTAMIFALLALVACSQPAETEIPKPTATPQAVVTDPPDPTQETPTARPTETPTAAPPPTATPVTTPTPTPTEQPTPTVAPTATATPNPEPVPATKAQPTQPAPTPIAIPEQPPLTPGPAPEALTPVWRGITVAPEDRCSPYDSDDYPYPPSVEPKIVAELGGIYGPYTGTWFEDIRETDIEHIVARSEAHDSGLCATTAETRKQFAADLLNLTLASPSVNRHQKSDNDAAEWLPDLNQCWYVDRVIQVRLQYDLSIDQSRGRSNRRGPGRLRINRDSHPRTRGYRTRRTRRRNTRRNTHPQPVRWTPWPFMTTTATDGSHATRPGTTT